MAVVFAPDSFKGTVPARRAAQALADGWRSVRPQDVAVLLPMADGGEGTLDAVAGGVRRRVSIVRGPDGRPVEAPWAMLADGTAVVELAGAGGLPLLRSPAPLTAGTEGFGQVVAEALDGDADRLLLAIGGSASTDGGAGLLRALGARFLDADGAELPPGGGALARLDRVDLRRLRPPPSGGVRVLTDVRNPLLGDRGAAAVYGPQKGATPGDVAVLERGLAVLAGHLPADPRAAGAGAAGGAAFGLLAWGATLVPGAPAVAAAIGLGAALAGAEAVVTGEGRFDDQSAQGKVPAEVARLAAVSGVPALLVAGTIEAAPSGFDAAVALADLVGLQQALAQPETALRRAGARLAGARGQGATAAS